MYMELFFSHNSLIDQTVSCFGTIIVERERERERETNIETQAFLARGNAIHKRNTHKKDIQPFHVLSWAVFFWGFAHAVFRSWTNITNL
jgi:hypothetical protein